MEAGDFHSGQEHKVRIRPDSQQGIHTYVYISIDLVFYIMSLWSRALGSLPSAWLMELWALPYPFDPTVVQPKARLVRAASSVEISHHLWSVLEHPRPGSIPVIYLLCRSWQCWFQCQHYRDWFVSTSFSLLQCVAIQGLVVCWQWSRRQHRLIDSSTHRLGITALQQIDSIRFDSWTRHLWFELCTFEPRVPQLCWRRHCNALNVYVPVLYVCVWNVNFTV